MLASLDIWAILGGLAVGIGGTLALGLLLGVLAVVDMGGQQDGAPFDDDAALEEEMRQLFAHPAMLLGLLVFSLLITVLAGFLTARWAQEAPVLNAAVMGVAFVALGALMDTEEARQVFPRWLMWSGYALTVPAAALGGWLYVLSLSSA